MKTPVSREPPKFVGIWVRVSSEDQAKGESPERHEQRARFYADSKGWEVKTVYHLEGVSGKSVQGHAECKRMLDDVSAGRIRALIFSKLARLARNTKELLEFSDLFRQANCDLISLQESIDTSTPSGRLFYTMIAAMAQWEREEIADRITSAFQIKAKLGKPLNAKASFGYHFINRELVPHPDEAPIRRRIYELFLETKRIRTTAKLLNEAGHRTHDGNKFTYSTIKRLIRDTTAKGVHIVNRTTNAGTRGNHVPKPIDQWVYRKVEAIIPEEMWEEANRILDDRSEEYKEKRPGPRPVHLFSGLAFCHCGQRMYPRVNTPKYVCSRCKNKIAIDVLEGIFYDQLKGFFLSREDVTKAIDEANTNLAERQKQLDSHLKELEKVREEMDRLYQLHMSGEIPAKGFGNRYRPLEEREQALEDELPKLQAELDVIRINQLSTEEVLSEATDLYARWPKLSFDDKRRIVESITEKLIIGKDEVSINLCYLPSSEEMTTKHRTLYGAARGKAAASRAPGVAPAVRRCCESWSSPKPPAR
ncbi:MAG: recombinase family protein [Verrucomicrobia bacterium]|nr:recombinase family protein [Verrucomicrobiota bacterium]